MTYSINSGTPYQSTYLGSLDPNLFLNSLPNNTSQLIFPEDVRDSLYTLWDNVTFKQAVSASSSIPYIGIGGNDHISKYLSGNDGLKMLLGKPYLSGLDTLGDDLINYSTGDSDIIVYNFKPDNYNGGGADQQFTKMLFLAGDNSNDLFLTAPYLKSQQNIGGTAIDFTIYNEGGSITLDSQDELIIGSPNTKITLMYGTGSTGIATLPGGLNGDVQLNLDNCEFGYVDGSSANIGNVLIMGASNSPYWGSLAINSVFTLNQVLTSGNTTDGNDIIITNSDNIYVGATGGTYMSINYNGTYHNINVPNSEFRISTPSLKLDVPGLGSTKVLFTDGSGYAYWATQSFATVGGADTNVQYNNGGVFGGTNLFNWKPSTSSLMINNPTGGSSSVSIKPNIYGGLHIDTNSSSNVLHVTDGISSIFKINSSNKSILFDTAADHNVVFGGSTVVSKYNFYNGSSLSNISFIADGTEEFNLIYQDSLGVKSSVISNSPNDSHGMYIGVINTLTQPIFIGSHDSSLATFDANIVSYPISSTMSSFIDQKILKSIVIGNSSITSPLSGTLLTTTDKRSLGINVTPEVNFDLNGVRSIRPISYRLTSSGTGKTLVDIGSSYITLDDPSDSGANVYRWGEFISNKLVTPYGTTIEVWNRTGGNITIYLLNSDLAGIYDIGQERNIFFPDITNTPGVTYTWETGNMLRFIYLSCDSSTGGDMYTNLSAASGTQLIDEGGVWYKVD